MKNPRSIEKTALAITRWIGSPTSIIIHTILFSISFLLATVGYIAFDRMLLVLTTIVSLEAIYLSIFIQMSLNYTTENIEEVSEDIEEMQEDIGEIQEDVDELQEDVEEISEDVGDITEDEKEEEAHAVQQKNTLETVQGDLRKLMEDIERLKENSK